MRRREFVRYSALASASVLVPDFLKAFGNRMIPAGGNGRILVSINRGSPARTIDHFAIGLPRFNADTGARYFAQRGATPLQGDYAGFHIKDPDGINVQISQR